MTVYYEGEYARVTHEVFDGTARFVIADLDQVHVSRPRSVKGVVALVAAATVVGVAGAAAVDAPRLVVAVVIGCVIGLLAVALSRVGGRRTAGLYGQYQGKCVCLFRTDDPRVFGQVSRALLRALERDRLRRLC